MKNSSKIGIVILVVIVIILAIALGNFVMKHPKSDENNENNSIVENNVDDNNETVENEITENIMGNELSQDVVEESNVTETENANNVQNTDTPQGREEQESNKEAQTGNPEEKAINLAKKEWGENSDVYNFVIDSVDGNIYTVAVRSANSTGVTTIAYFKVNVDTEEVVEQ